MPLAFAQAPPAPKPRPQTPNWAFGDRVTVRNCLRFQVSDYRDRQADVENHDWIKFRVENVCRGAIRALAVELLLIDNQGARYGGPYWVVGSGEQLVPGGVWEKDVAVPDPDSRVARRWSVRILRADGLPRPEAKAPEKK
jgi:hypothetical protein